MKIKAEDIEAELGNNGITLRIWGNDEKLRGRLQVGSAKIRWWKGGASTTYTDVRLEDMIDWLEKQSK